MQLFISWRSPSQSRFGVKPPLVQTALLGGVVRNFKHQTDCQNSGEKI